MAGRLPKKIELRDSEFQLVPYRTKVLNPSASKESRYVCYLWQVSNDSDRSSKPQEVVANDSVPLYAWLTNDNMFTYGVRQHLPESLKAASALDETLDGALDSPLELRYVMASDVNNSTATGVCQTYLK